MDILNMIKKRRKKLNLTQQQVADRLHVSRNTYTQYENGTRKIDTETFFALVEILDMNITIKDYLQSDIYLQEINEKHDEWKREHHRFFEAIAENDVEKVRWYLDNGMDINEQNEEGMDAYIYGLTQNAHQVVAYFLEEKIISDMMDAVKHACTPLAFACAYGGFETAKLLLEHGANPNQLSFVHEEKLPPLYIAARMKNKEIFALLMEHGADINQKVSVSDEEDDSVDYEFDFYIKKLEEQMGEELDIEEIERLRIEFDEEELDFDGYVEFLETLAGRKLNEGELERARKEFDEENNEEEENEIKTLRDEFGFAPEAGMKRNIFYDMLVVFVSENMNEPRLEPLKKTTSQAEMMKFVYNSYKHLMEKEVAETGEEFLREFP